MGQRAIWLAKADRLPKKAGPGRGHKKAPHVVAFNVPQQRLSDARMILDWAPALAEQVIENKGGELLKKTEKAKRGPDKETGQRSQRGTSEKTLADMGVTKKQSAKWQQRRNISRGQQAMSMAFIYPEPEKGGRGKKSENTKETLGYSIMRLSQARLVLRSDPDLARSVMR